MAKLRPEIPVNIAAKILFLSDRTCCVCRQAGKKVQIHHIDENPSNSAESNLAILCFECHTETMIRGGFHRKLNAEQVILYRNDWLNIVSRKRGLAHTTNQGDAEENSRELELATSVAEIYRENEEYELLAIHYHNIENDELRDKYIEKVLNENPSDHSIVFLRGLQGKGREVSLEVVNRLVTRYEAIENYLEIARIYKQVDNPLESVKYYLKGVASVFGEKNYFTTAFYLRELVEDGLIEDLLAKAYAKANKSGDLWWQIRALQELKWDTELNDLIIESKEEILRSNDPKLLQLLAKQEGNEKKYIEYVKDEAQSTTMKVEDND